MNNILILYPKEFKCKSKFERKVSKITKNIDNYAVYYIEDYNNFIETYFDKITTYKIEINNLENITHAIIFDDGEEFAKELKYFKSKAIPFRYINISITRVINIKTDTKYDKNTKEYEYIGRGSYWGNPYSMFENGETREEVIRKYAYDFEQDIFIKEKRRGI
jgi:hypothetical protein